MIIARILRNKMPSLVAVDLGRAICVSIDDIAISAQAVMDQWDELTPRIIERLSERDETASDALDVSSCKFIAPLPRAYQFLDSAVYLSHIQRVRAARGAELPVGLLDAPMMYQGISAPIDGPEDPIVAGDDREHGIDFEAEIAVVTGAVPQGVSRSEASGYIRFIALLNDISLRGIIPPELKRGFGFLQGKPKSALGPFLVTPDEFGDDWDGKLVHGEVRCHVRGDCIGRLNPGVDAQFGYDELIVHAARTRPLVEGTILGAGTISNVDERAGVGCIGELRALEQVKHGKPRTEFLRFGDTVKLEYFDTTGRPLLGTISQTVSDAKLIGT